MNYGILFIIAGVLIMFFANPKIARPLMARLQNEGLVIPRRYKPRDVEVIKHGGRELSIFAIGFVLFFFGLISTLFS